MIVPACGDSTVIEQAGPRQYKEHVRVDGVAVGIHKKRPRILDNALGVELGIYVVRPPIAAVGVGAEAREEAAQLHFVERLVVQHLRPSEVRDVVVVRVRVGVVGLEGERILVARPHHVVVACHL